MKKLITGFILSLISIATFACHFNPLGECSGNAYFMTQLFNPNSQYVFKTATGDTLLIFSTGTTIVDSIFNLPVPANTAVYMDYNYIGSDYIEHYTNTSSADEYSGCGALGVTLSNISVKKENDEVIVSFDAGEEIGIDHYNIQGSFNSKDWVTIGTQAANGSRHYSIPLGAATATAALFLSLLFLRTKKRWISVLCIMLAIGTYSCKKELNEKQVTNYRYYRVQTIDKSGTSVLSDIKVIS